MYIPLGASLPFLSLPFQTISLTPADSCFSKPSISCPRRFKTRNFTFADVGISYLTGWLILIEGVMLSLGWYLVLRNGGSLVVNDSVGWVVTVSIDCRVIRSEARSVYGPRTSEVPRTSVFPRSQSDVGC